MFTVFLDRDGVINRNRADYVKDWNEFHFLPGARRAIGRLTQEGYRIFIITNQACVGKGLLSRPALEAMHRRMQREIKGAGGHIEAVLYCPHRSDEACDCRKPAPGLLLRAQNEYGVDLHQAVLVGDSLTDMAAAAAAEVPGILVFSGLGWHAALHAPRAASFGWQPALNLAHAVAIIRRRAPVANSPTLPAISALPAVPAMASWWLSGVLSGARKVETWL
ncbi:MAG TPA: HAD family hydrolase [Ktedonobacterales bacterium]|nr:HAD family hydrolase [Ktedonobacterales bacterium]